MQVSAILCTHNPNAARLQRTLLGLRAQTLQASSWELVLVDNASRPPLTLDAISDFAHPHLRVITEPALGLSAARRRGLLETRSEFIVFVDDDNVLAPDYLEHAVEAMRRLPRVGAVGGKALPEFETKPPDWAKEFLPLLALRNFGEQELVSTSLRNPSTDRNEYPLIAPIGAGMVLRREAAEVWLSAPASVTTDRRGAELSSGGDNDIVLTLMKTGWEVAYIPKLILTHLIPATRLEPQYLARLNRGIQQSWTRVLLAHHASPWPAVAPWTVPLRKLKAWFVYRAWSSLAARVRWHGACGHFEGRRPVN